MQLALVFSLLFAAVVVTGPPVACGQEAVRRDQSEKEAVSESPEQPGSQRESQSVFTSEPVEPPFVVAEATPASMEASGVTSVHQLQLSGSFSLVGIAGSSRAFVPWNPLFMLPESPFGLDTNTVELHARQSSLTAQYEGPEVHGFATGGLLKVYLLADSITSDTYGLLPVVAFGEMRNDRWRISGGLQPDLFAPRDPVLIPTVLLGGSGNPGTFRGQLRVERFLADEKQLSSVLQFALSDPITTILVDSSRRTTESNGWPNVEARLAVGLGEQAKRGGGRNEREAEIGVSGVVGQVRNTRVVFDLEDLEDAAQARHVIDVWGLAVDGKANVTDRVGVAGEFFVGEAIGNYAANIFQSFNPVTFAPVRGSGGWGEVFWYLTDALHLHTGYGIEAPHEAQLSTETGISRNETWYANWIWDVGRSVQLSFEVDYRQTEFVSLADGKGTLYMGQFLWRF